MASKKKTPAPSVKGQHDEASPPPPVSQPPSPGYPADDRLAALADGLRKSHREDGMRDREYARQMVEITQEDRE